MDRGKENSALRECSVKLITYHSAQASRGRQPAAEQYTERQKYCEPYTKMLYSPDIMATIMQSHTKKIYGKHTIGKRGFIKRKKQEI